MWSRKAECALNAHVKEKLCLNYIVVTAEESISIVLRTVPPESTNGLQTSSIFICVYAVQSLKFTSWIQVLRAKHIQQSAHLQSSPKDLLMESLHTNLFHSWIYQACVVTIPSQSESPCALGKAAVPARRDFYLMPEYVHPASPTATDLLKNLTEKIGTHTLFYDQNTAKQNHSKQ